MFRCPTCITVLTDPRGSRCHACRQRIRRRGPRVLGEERRLGARLLPIDRALAERLYRNSITSRWRVRGGEPWAGRFLTPGPAGPDLSQEPARPSNGAIRVFDLPAEGTLGIAPADVRSLPVDTGIVAAPACEPLPVVPAPLDPDVQALVDDLYRRARHEIGGDLDKRPPDTASVAPEPQLNRRGGWVPALLTDRRRAEGSGTGDPAPFDIGRSGRH